MTIEEELIKLFDMMADDPRFHKPIKQIIDDECVGCCAAADLQQELDECRKQLSEHEKRLDRFIDDYIDQRVCLQQIKRLKSKITMKDKALVAAREIVGESYQLATHYKAENERLETTVAEKNSTIDDLTTWYRYVIEEREKTIELKQETIKDLEDELSVRKRDSKVLMKIVEAFEGWDRDCIVSLRMICALLNNYLNPSEPLEEEHSIIVEVNSAEDVAPIVEKIAESVAARIKCPVRVQFVTEDDSNDR